MTNQPPQGGSGDLMLGGLAMGIMAASLIWWAFRRMRGRHRRYDDGPRMSMGGVSVGNALFELNAALQPDRPNVETIMRLEEEEEEQEVVLDGRDNEMEPPDPAAGSPFRVQAEGEKREENEASPGASGPRVGSRGLLSPDVRRGAR